MKKLIILAMVIGLFMAGTARADGAWVLWEKITDGWNNEIKWNIIVAYPSYASCNQQALSTCEMYQELYGSKCLKAKGYYEYRFNNTGSLKGSLYEWKCLPESVDPRK